MTVSRRIERLLDTLTELSEDHMSEVQNFAEFLKTKTQKGRVRKKPRKIVRLEGQWKDVPFDITNEEIREARRELGQQIAFTKERK